MVKKMFRIVELEDCEIKQYVFLTDAESVESQLDDIYDALKDKTLQYKFGRPKMELPDNFEEVVKRFCNREINNIEACKLLNMSRGTFFRYVKLYRGRKNE